MLIFFTVLLWYLVGVAGASFFVYVMAYYDDGAITLTGLLFILLAAIGGIVTLVVCIIGVAEDTKFFGDVLLHKMNNITLFKIKPEPEDD